MVQVVGEIAHVVSEGDVVSWVDELVVAAMLSAREIWLRTTMPSHK